MARLLSLHDQDGNFRFQLEPSDDISTLVAKILETSSEIDPDTLALSNQPRGGENLVSSIQGNLASLGINHGDLLFASYRPKAAPSALSSAPTPAPASTPAPAAAHTLSGKTVPIEPEAGPVPSTSTAPASATTNTVRVPGGQKPWEHVHQNSVDDYWQQQDGKIPREKGKHGCRCGPKSMCDYCMPLEPFDAEYHQTHSIKHLSYHAYLKKLHAAVPTSAQASTYIPPLADPSYRVQVPCASGAHPSWPAGICTKCQPSAVTLSRQAYRMTDHVEFATPALVEGILAFWRQTGTQRFGYLLGTYQPYDKVPMGVKAVVEAIHEPAQEPHADGITVGFPWNEHAKVEALAEACGNGLQVVGVVFTDLTQDATSDESKRQGKVVAKRHANSFFLSGLEVLFAATLQRQFPTASRFSIDGKFSSRFVTCVISGDIEGQISVEAYQVSDQAMAMVDADMVEASVDPGVVRVKEEGPERYIPDVFYRYKNKYGLEVKDNAKPCFPVEYLIVNVSHGFPVAPNPLFTTKTPFTAENRAGLSDQTLNSVVSSFSRTISSASLPAPFLHSIDKDVVDRLVNEGETGRNQLQGLLDWFSDWHLLRYLADCGIFDENDIRVMCQLATVSRHPERDYFVAQTLSKLYSSPNWQTFLMIVSQQQQETTNNLPDKDYPGQPQQQQQQQQQMIDGFEIPPDVDVPPDSFPREPSTTTTSTSTATEGGGGGGGMQVCPHCTFENEPGVQDCDICGLPLSG
ncbi:nuclear protein localization protein 4 [Sporobolomyces koalae]|uniref:nuclear protein localization protein 4 n=1 Tax=Sporobolomyces koalae TaxID=500713 RepID=UPI00316E180B